MKAITLKQPWATLVSEGIKIYEFRSWKTNYRGKVLIHAGSTVDKKELERFKDLNLEYPTKRILAEVEIVDCIKMDEDFNKKLAKENKLLYSNKIRTGYAWKIANVKKIKSNKTINGKLSFWNIERKDYE